MPGGGLGGSVRKLFGRAFERSQIKQQLKHQLDLNIQRPKETDRNYARGGRSFYFFDFDDNIAVLSTPILIFHKETGKSLRLSSREFGEQSGSIGRSGPFRDYEIRWDDRTGSFQYFRDRPLSVLEKLLGKKQVFVQDLMLALGLPEYHWRGPSWNCFYHAVYNQRPISLITARGHHPQTIKEGFRCMVNDGHIPHEPNYLAIYPINHPETRRAMNQATDTSVAEMKQAAIRASVERAFREYGSSPYHRFGMSDDDPRNVELIIEEMSRLKREYPENSFFVFDTHKGQFLRREVFHDHTMDQILNRHVDQLPLF